jgi:hypothetical protein
MLLTIYEDTEYQTYEEKYGKNKRDPIVKKYIVASRDVTTYHDQTFTIEL